LLQVTDPIETSFVTLIVVQSFKTIPISDGGIGIVVKSHVMAQ